MKILLTGKTVTFVKYRNQNTNKCPGWTQVRVKNVKALLKFFTIYIEYGADWYFFMFHPNNKVPPHHSTQLFLKS